VVAVRDVDDLLDPVDVEANDATTMRPRALLNTRSIAGSRSRSLATKPTRRWWSRP
jgi:hypothetical protein